MADSEVMTKNGIEKASMLLIALGAEASSEVLKHLSQSEVEQLTAEIVRHRFLTLEKKKAILEEFKTACEVGAVAAMGGTEYAAALLKNALGEEKSSEIVGKLTTNAEPKPFDWLAKLDPNKVAKVLSEELPQTCALVISHLPTETAANILAGLPGDLQGEVAIKIASLGPWNPNVVAQIEEALKKKLTAKGEEGKKAVSGSKALVDILRYAPRKTERIVLQTLEGKDPNVAEEVRSMMFVFEDIPTLDDKSIQAMLREVEQEDLRMALKSAPEEVKDAIFRNLSERAAEALKEDMELSGAVRKRDVEAAQSRMVAVLRKMEERGDIVLKSSGNEEDALVG